MKKLISIVLVIVVLCSALALCASADIMVPYATRTCPACGRAGTATVTCDKNSDTMSPALDVECSSHYPCTITNRLQSTVSYTCSNTNCQAYYSSKNYGTHIESVYHTFTKTTHNVCNY